MIKARRLFSVDNAFYVGYNASNAITATQHSIFKGEMNGMTIVDSHIHIMNTNGNFAPVYALAERLGYSQLALQSLQCTGDLLQNTACALCKVLHPGTTYAFGGLDYATGRDYLAQAKNLREMGFDGIKMLEGKPTTRRMLGKALDDPIYDAYFGYLEATGFPV